MFAFGSWGFLPPSPEAWTRGPCSAAAAPCECECSSAPRCCLADLDPRAGHRWQRPGLFYLRLGFWGHVCDLQPALQPLLDHAEAHAGPGVLLGLCPHHLRGSPAQVWCCLVIKRVSEITGFEFSRKLLQMEGGLSSLGVHRVGQLSFSRSSKDLDPFLSFCSATFRVALICLIEEDSPVAHQCPYLPPLLA